MFALIKGIKSISLLVTETKNGFCAGPRSSTSGPIELKTSHRALVVCFGWALLDIEMTVAETEEQADDGDHNEPKP